MNERFVESSNLALDKTAREMSVDEPASSAVDGDLDTYSCTLAKSGIPWWAVDLGQDYDIGRVIITLPNVNGDKRNNYRPLQARRAFLLNLGYFGFCQLQGQI